MTRTLNKLVNEIKFIKKMFNDWILSSIKIDHDIYISKIKLCDQFLLYINNLKNKNTLNSRD